MWRCEPFLGLSYGSFLADQGILRGYNAIGKKPKTAADRCASPASLLTWSFDEGAEKGSAMRVPRRKKRRALSLLVMCRS